MFAVGVDAFPMVGIMAVCAGFILAIQGASELSRFGAMQFVVDLVTIGFTREMGPLLTAIAVSGRSGSALAAEIGSMVVTEESMLCARWLSIRSSSCSLQSSRPP
jgi:phospholipid/cholesterol/gamma-HCH transport system permease protein